MSCEIRKKKKVTFATSRSASLSDDTFPRLTTTFVFDPDVEKYSDSDVDDDIIQSSHCDCNFQPVDPNRGCCSPPSFLKIFDWFQCNLARTSR